ncbi:EamA family transporter [Ruminococcus sp. OM05-10BH]|nr:EamA family transporter [Ruminococcus sp. OM05-10BH]
MHKLTKHKDLLGTISIIIATLCWGFSGCSGQYLLHDLALPTPVVLCIRQISAGVILILLDLILGRKNRHSSSRPSIWQSREDTMTLIFFAIFGICLTQFTFFMAIYYSDSGTATVLQYLSTIIILIVTCIQMRRLPGKTETAAILMAVAGTFLISTGGRPGNLAISGYALFFGLICAFSYSTYTLIPGKIVRTYGAKYIVGRGMLISGIFFSIFVRPWTYSIDITPQVILGFCGLILIGTAAGSTFYHFGASLLPPVKAGTLANFDPVSSVILTALLLGTRFTTADLAGFLCIIGAVFLLQFYRSRKQRE